MNGMTITIAAGGAVSDSRDSFLTNEARRAAGRCLATGQFLSHAVDPIEFTLNSGTGLSDGRSATDVLSEGHCDRGNRKDECRRKDSPCIKVRA